MPAVQCALLFCFCEVTADSGLDEGCVLAVSSTMVPSDCIAFLGNKLRISYGNYVAICRLCKIGSSRFTLSDRV